MEIGFQKFASGKRILWFLRLPFVLIPISITVLVGCNFNTSMSKDRNVDFQQNYEITVQNETDQISLVSEDEHMIVNIQSPQGIGAAEIRSLAGGFPHDTLIRVYLEGLEEFVFKYDQKALRLSVPSHPDLDVQQTLKEGGEEVIVPPYTSYWLAVSHVEMDDTGKDGYYEISLPPDFRALNLDEFSLSWIDFYR